MIKKTQILIFAIFVSSTVSSNGYTLLDSANANYTKNNFYEAIEFYEKIISSNFESSETYYNLGNSYYKVGNISSSIINYERALLLSPNNKDIIHNLKVVNLQIVDKIETLPEFFLTSWLNIIKQTLSSNNWATVSMISFIVFILTLLLFFFTQKSSIKKLSFVFGTFIIIISVISYSFSANQKNIITDHKSAIVVSQTVAVKSSPDEDGTEIFILHEGTKLNLKDKVNNWLEINLQDGSVGWLKGSDVEII